MARVSISISDTEQDDFDVHLEFDPPLDDHGGPIVKFTSAQTAVNAALSAMRDIPDGRIGTGMHRHAFTINVWDRLDRDGIGVASVPPINVDDRSEMSAAKHAAAVAMTAMASFLRP